MPRPGRWLAGLLALVAALPAVASAHEGDPRYRSIVRALDPPTSGLRVEVLNYDDSFELTNDSGETVVILGYDGEPYARIDADGAVAVNRNSPASYLNGDRYAESGVPKAVRDDPGRAPEWEPQAGTGRFAWHDHRMHWMSRSVAPQVKDESARTRVLDYEIPLRVGGRPVQIEGTLWWVGAQDGGGAPVGALVALGVVALAALAAVLAVRRRRGGSGGSDGGSDVSRGGDGAGPGDAASGRGAPSAPPREAW